MPEQKQFMFRVPVKNIDAALAKVRQFFQEQGIVIDGYGFEGKGYKGWYAIADHDILITITKKPIWVFNYVMVDKVRKFLEGV